MDVLYHFTIVGSYFTTSTGRTEIPGQAFASPGSLDNQDLLLEMFLLGKKRQSDEDEPAVIRVSGQKSSQEAPEVSL